MAGKQVATCGLITCVPIDEVVLSGGRNDSFETQNSSKILYKDYGGGCSSKFTETHKSGGFVDRRNGNQGFKEEVNYKSNFKVNDNIHGCTTEYETQVKCKKVTTYTSPNKGYGYNKVTPYTRPSAGGKGSRSGGGSKKTNLL